MSSALLVIIHAKNETNLFYFFMLLLASLRILAIHNCRIFMLFKNSNTSSFH